MTTKTIAEKIKALQAPFKADRVEWRIQQSGSSNGNPWAMVLAYLDNRAVQERLDEVFTPFGWRNEYKEGANGGIMCGISIKAEDGEWITKWDGAENTAVEAVKGGMSAAMKRAAVQWGIGRYLYDLPSTFLPKQNISSNRVNGWNKAKTKNNEWFYWCPPALPANFLPAKDNTKTKGSGDYAEPEGTQTNEQPAQKQQPKTKPAPPKPTKSFDEMNANEIAEAFIHFYPQFAEKTRKKIEASGAESIAPNLLKILKGEK